MVHRFCSYLEMLVAIVKSVPSPQKLRDTITMSFVTIRTVLRQVLEAWIFS